MDESGGCIVFEKVWWVTEWIIAITLGSVLAFLLSMAVVIGCGILAQTCKWMWKRITRRSK